MLVIWNPNAGSTSRAEPIRRELEARPDTELRETESGKEAIEIVAKRISKGERQIVAAGGDGTINAVINGMMRHPTTATLGVLPLGTANDWCTSLNVPDDLHEALSLIDNRPPRPVDVVCVETPTSTKYYANIATGGNSHRVTESITTEMKQTWGALCYLRGAIGVISDLGTFRTEISFDDGPAESFDAWNIIVANGRTSGGQLAIAPKAKIDDGLLDIVIIRNGTLLDLASLTVQVVATSTYLDSDQVEYRRARKMAITSEPPILFSIDGDLIEDQPLRFYACPGQLLVVTGASTDD